MSAQTAVQLKDAAGNLLVNQYYDSGTDRYLVGANPGGGGGGGGLSDTILTDDSGTQFLARDNGTTITYVTLSGAGYTPTTNIRAVSMAGGATAAKQDTGNTSLATIATNTTGAATAAAQATGNTSAAASAAVLGAQADAAATTDTGTFSLAALVKRALQNWTMLLARVPALVGGLFPVSVGNPTTAGANVQLASIFYVPSTGNSSTSQLTAGITFPGAIETAQNQPSVVISALMDQPYTITIYQYDDVAGAKIASTDVATRAANQPYNEAIQVNGNYVKVTVTNNGASTSTTFYVDTFYGIMPVSPRTLTNLSNNRVSINEVGGTATNGAVPVAGSTQPSTASFTRPANTTAYAALSTVSDSTSAPTLLTFSNIARIAAGTGYITKARLMTDGATNVARFRLHLYHTAPTQINDGSPFTELWVNRANRIGRIDFDACFTEGTGSTAAGSLNTAVRLAFGCDSGLQAVYGILESLDPFTPASGQNFYIELTAEQN